jgi:hypothetical protein
MPGASGGACIEKAVRGCLLGAALAMFCGAAISPATADNDLHRLSGRWLRTDGGYVLELRDFKEDGTLKARYFNPRSIHVSRAAFHREDGKVALFIELRDVNYPGSTYKLRYDRARDRLTGTYFQAVLGEIYDVEFVRMK